MKLIPKALLLTSVLALAACSTKRDFEGDGAAGLNAPPVVDPAPTLPALAPNSVAYFQQTVGDRVLFEVNQSDLTGQGRIILEGQARWLTANPDYTAVIEGHADEQGTREYNLALGARRADVVKAYLISKGIASSRLKVVSYGKERPLEICSSEDCYAKNRRAVTVLAGGLTS